jgi:hypothetical protein
MNPFASRFSEVLFGRFPEWRKLATVDPPGALLPGALGVEVPSPRDNAKLLYIDTDVDEVTISFDMWHSHYGQWSGVAEAESFQEAIQFIADLIEEEVAVLVKTRGGEWVASQLLYQNDAVPPLKPGEEMRVVSWRGGRDRVYTTGNVVEVLALD